MHTAAGPRAFGLTAWRAAERIGDAAFGSACNPLRHLGAIGFFAFWLLAATDGHGKNFSLHHRAGGFYSLTPLYDVLSAWPMIGSGPNQLPLQDAKLALAVTGRNRHYKLVEIQARHWQALALRVGGAPLWQRMRTLVESVDAALERVCGQVPPGFPAVVMDTISAGVRRQAVTFLRAAPVA